jgi:hypothetical protein
VRKVSVAERYSKTSVPAIAIAFRRWNIARSLLPANRGGRKTRRPDEAFEDIAAKGLEKRSEIMSR